MGHRQLALQAHPLFARSNGPACLPTRTVPDAPEGLRAMSLSAPGRWQELPLESEALRGNPLGDPHERPVFVWTPPSYDAEPERRYASVYVLQGMFGQARAWFNVSPFQ